MMKSDEKNLQIGLVYVIRMKLQKLKLLIPATNATSKKSSNATSKKSSNSLLTYQKGSAPLPLYSDLQDSSLQLRTSHTHQQTEKPLKDLMQQPTEKPLKDLFFFWGTMPKSHIACIYTHPSLSCMVTPFEISCLQPCWLYIPLYCNSINVIYCAYIQWVYQLEVRWFAETAWFCFVEKCWRVFWFLEFISFHIVNSSWSSGLLLGHESCSPSA